MALFLPTAMGVLQILLEGLHLQFLEPQIPEDLLPLLHVVLILPLLYLILNRLILDLVGPLVIAPNLNPVVAGSEFDLLQL